MEIKNTLRTFEAQKGVKFKNIEPELKITGSYKKKRVYREATISKSSFESSLESLMDFSKMRLKVALYVVA